MVFATEQIRRMRGGAQSHMMRCSDGNYYVVKFQNNPRLRRISVNELLGTRLPRRLGRPTTPVEIIHVSEELIRLTPELSMQMPHSGVPCHSDILPTKRTITLNLPRSPTSGSRAKMTVIASSWTRGEAGIEPVPTEGLAVWVAKLRPSLLQ
jgi:hypothetical protein